MSTVLLVSTKTTFPYDFQIMKQFQFNFHETVYTKILLHIQAAQPECK